MGNKIVTEADRKRTPQPKPLPGVTLNTSPTDHAPIETVQMVRFDGTEWAPFDGVLK